MCVPITWNLTGGSPAAAAFVPFKMPMHVTVPVGRSLVAMLSHNIYTFNRIVWPWLNRTTTTFLRARHDDARLRHSNLCTSWGRRAPNTQLFSRFNKHTTLHIWSTLFERPPLDHHHTSQVTFLLIQYSNRSISQPTLSRLHYLMILCSSYIHREAWLGSHPTLNWCKHIDREEELCISIHYTSIQISRTTKKLKYGHRAHPNESGRPTEQQPTTLQTLYIFGVRSDWSLFCDYILRWLADPTTQL